MNQCLNCTDNTAGDHCERCADGYYGDTTNGGSCQCEYARCSDSKSGELVAFFINQRGLVESARRQLPLPPPRFRVWALRLQTAQYNNFNQPRSIFFFRATLTHYPQDRAEADRIALSLINHIHIARERHQLIIVIIAIENPFVSVLIVSICRYFIVWGYSP